MEITQEQVKDILKRIEKRLALMQKKKYDFYYECGISSALYSNWNTGKAKPSPTTLAKIAEYLDVSYEWLVTGEEQDETMRIREQILNRPEVRMLFNAISDDVPASEILSATAQILKYKEQKNDS